MKISHIAALALIASAATGFNAYAQSADVGIDPAQKFVSTLSRAEVQTEAAKAARDTFQRGYNYDSGEYLISAPAQPSSMSLTREAVRADAIKARGTKPLIDNAG